MTSMRRSIVLALAGLSAVSLVAVPAGADDTFTGFGSSDFMNSMMDNVRMDSMRRSMLRDDDEPRSPYRDRKATPPPVRPATPTRPAAAQPRRQTQPTTYRASPAVTARVCEQFVKWVGQTSGQQGEAAMRELMQKQDVLALWTRQMKADGLKPGDLVDAFTAYWVQNWQVANSVEVTTPSQVMAVRRQVAASMGGGAAAALTEAHRQELAEVFIYNQFIQGAVWAEATGRGDASLKRKLSDAAVARFRNEMKLDLRALKLTERGFVAG